MCFSIFCLLIPIYLLFFFFFFNDTATTEIYTLSLHDALPIWDGVKDSTVFSYRLPEAMPVTIQVSDEQSRLLRTRSEEHTSELQSQSNLVCRLLLEKKKKQQPDPIKQISTITTVEARRCTLA